MSLKQKIKKIKSTYNLNHFLIYGLILMISIDGFLIGHISNIKKEPIIFKDDFFTIEWNKNSDETKKGKYGASLNGTKYYLTTCSGFNRIKEENKTYFNSVEEAERAGYGPASNCPGL